MAKYRGVLKPKDDISRRLGERFKRLRLAAGATQEEVAAAMRRNFFLVRRHEAGTMPLRADDLVRAAQILKVAPAALLEDIDDG